APTAAEDLDALDDLDVAEPVLEDEAAILEGEVGEDGVVVEDVIVDEAVLGDSLEGVEPAEADLAADEIDGGVAEGQAEAKAAEEEDAFVLSDDDDDAPAQQVATAGATADPVKDYLKQIGKVALLNAEQEVELAKRIEAGLFAEEKINSGERLEPK